MLLAAAFTRALERLAIPITGVSFPVIANRATWVIHYAPEATPAQIAQGDALRFTYDPAADAAWQDEQADRAVDEQKALRALARATWEYKANTWTFLEFVARIKAIYKTL